MYNDAMPDTYEIRKCESCGLRYPLVDAHHFGRRCPACLGTTRIILSQELSAEPDPGRGARKAVMAQSSLKNAEANDVPQSGMAPKALNSGKSLAVLLDNIRSAWNVGSILRSADGFGFAQAFLCGITPMPDNEAVAKTSLGAEDSVPWSYHKDAVMLVDGLKGEGWKVLALEEDQRAISIEDASASLGLETARSNGGSARSSPDASRERAVLIVGNEVTGVDPGLLELCDNIFYIPMRGKKKSFNVAIAFGIAAYALTLHTSER
jgi:tRNA G18 (ribose-2'-O)-methylase SpoU